MIELCRALARCGDSQEPTQEAGMAILRLHDLHAVCRQLFERHR